MIEDFQVEQSYVGTHVWSGVARALSCAALAGIQPDTERCAGKKALPGKVVMGL